jgi:hypothetical protein
MAAIAQHTMIGHNDEWLERREILQSRNVVRLPASAACHPATTSEPRIWHSPPFHDLAL